MRRDDLFLVLYYLALVFTVPFLMVLASCKAPLPKVYPLRPMIDQILSPYPGEKGFVHRVCRKYSEDGICDEWYWDRYLLTNPTTRKNLLRLKFICNVGGRPFAPCENENALCLYHDCSRGFLRLGRRKCKLTKLSMVDDYDFLVKAQTFCRSSLRYEL